MGTICNQNTVMDKSIHTLVKRQYINALFEMAVYHRNRGATIINFLSFISIDIKGFSFNFGQKLLTGFEMAELERYTSTFFLYFITLNVKKCFNFQVLPFQSQGKIFCQN